jgi:hypothetical protein
MERLTPVKAMRAKCLDCMGGQPSGVRKCEFNECPLFNYRMGKNPNRKGIGGRQKEKVRKHQLECAETLK